MNSHLSLIVLIIAIFSAGVGIVSTKQQSRKLFIDLQALQVRRDDLQIEWAQLRLEESTLTTEAMVDQMARTRLDMIIPDPNSVVYIRP